MIFNIFNKKKKVDRTIDDKLDGLDKNNNKESEFRGISDIFSSKDEVYKNEIFEAGRIYDLNEEYCFVQTPQKPGKEVKFNIFEKGIHLAREREFQKIFLYVDDKLQEVSGRNKFTLISEEECIKKVNFDIITSQNKLIKTKIYDVEFLGKEKNYKHSVEFFVRDKEEIGKYANISSTIATSGDNQKIKNLILYEDGKEIARKDTPEEIYAIYPSFLIRKDEPQKHEYKLVSEDFKGNIFYSEIKKIEFSGEYLAPKINDFWVHDPGNENIFIFLNAYDSNNGPETGLEKTLLYENDKVIREIEKNHNYSEEMLKKPGDYVYRAEVFNKSGKKATSEEIIVNFK